MTVLEAIVLAIIEGLTEFLPVSSTGHIIIGSSVMGISSHPFTKLFTVAVQLGSILSVVVLYWKRFFQSLGFYFKIGLAVIPIGISGYLLSDYVDSMFERIDVVGYMLLIGGVIFLFIDKVFEGNENHTNPEITFPVALKIGIFQCIALIPGVSRSAATIIGGLTQKLNRRTAAEFSFFLAVPTMLASTAFKLYSFYREGEILSSNEITWLILGNVISFIVAAITIKSLIRFLTNHGFKFFGYYRIALGLILLLLYYLGVELTVV